jgi:hypothetical protein
MKKRLIGILLILVLATQIFPVDGLRFWSQIMQSTDEISTSVLLTIEEEEVEQVQFKLKNIDSSKAHFYERITNVSNVQAVYKTISHIGKVIDRNDPILIPPPNPTI